MRTRRANRRRLRLGDLLALDWSALETQAGAFTFGWAPRRKTQRPQKLDIPAVLRPFIADWWHRAGRPSRGLVFPALRGDNAGTGQKRGASPAAALRADLERAFTAACARGVDAPKGPRAQPKGENLTSAERGADARWIALIEGTEQVKRVDFHSWRRAYNQALADAGVNAQQAAALAGHADLGAHMRYLTNTGKSRRVPDAALPDLIVSSATRTEPIAEIASSTADHDTSDGTKNAASSDTCGVPESWLRGRDFTIRGEHRS